MRLPLPHLYDMEGEGDTRFTLAVIFVWCLVFIVLALIAYFAIGVHVNVDPYTHNPILGQ